MRKNYAKIIGFETKFAMKFAMNKAGILPFRTPAFGYHDIIPVALCFGKIL